MDAPSPQRRLDFDSDLFGFPVVILDSASLDAATLAASLRTNAANDVRLVYWPARPTPENDAAAAACQGFLADRRTTYGCRLQDTDLVATDDWPDGIAAYEHETIRDDLVDLAIASGEQSRFRTDPRVPRSVGDELYRRWLENSVRGDLADVTLVATSEESEPRDSIVGLVTVKHRGDHSDIGLIAVDAAVRGRSIGTRLIRAAQLWSLSHECTENRVVTQGDNLVAKRLYERCDYEVKSVEHYYHFWL